MAAIVTGQGGIYQLNHAPTPTLFSSPENAAPMDMLAWFAWNAR